MTKKVKIAAIIIPIVAAACIGGGFYYHHVQVVKAEELKIAQEKKDAKFDALEKTYTATETEITNGIFSDDDRANLNKTLVSYQKGIKKETLTAKKITAFKAFVKDTDKKYTDGKATLDSAMAGIQTAYPTDMTYYSDDFKASLATMTNDYNTLVAAGKYQEAYNKFNEINGTYAAYVEQVNAQKAAEEEAAKQKAEAEAAAKKKAATQSASNKGTKNSSSSSGSSSSSSGSDSSASASSGSSSQSQSVPAGYSSLEDYQGSLAAKAEANSVGHPVPYNGGVMPPDGWSVSKTDDWCFANGYYW